MRHLLVTNDFPPKHGGIQSYLWELWRRLPPDDVVVFTTPHPDAAAFDAAQPFRVVRSREPVLLPRPGMAGTVRRLARRVGAGAVVLDPALPLGWIGPQLDLPYAVVLHGAEVTVPARLPGLRQALARVLRGASLVIAAGGYPAAEGEHATRCALPTVVVPPGVDSSRFHPLDVAERAAARARLGLPLDATIVLGLSRLVPRKGFDVVIDAVARLARSRRGLLLVLAGAGRDRGRLERRAAAAGAPVRFLGRLPDETLADAYGAADVFAMLCRNRWGGLEQEGFGIVFVEAAAAGVASVAGVSGGSAEAVADGETGVVLDAPRDVGTVTAALAGLIDDPAVRVRMGAAARRRAVAEHDYDRLAERLASALAGMKAPS